MTRETKLGIGVATSFLSLVGLVAYNAWQKKDGPPAPLAAPPTVAVAQVPAAKAEQKPAQAPAVERAEFKEDRGAPVPAAPQPFPLGQGSGPGVGGVAVSPVPPPSGDGIQLEGSPLPPGAPVTVSPAAPPAPKSGVIEMPPPDLAMKTPAIEQPKGPVPPPAAILPLPPLGEMTAKGPAAPDTRPEPGAPVGVPGMPLPAIANTPPASLIALPANPSPLAGNPNPLPTNPTPLPANPDPLPANPSPLPANPTPLPPGAVAVNPPDQKQTVQVPSAPVPVNPAEQKSLAGGGQMPEIGTQNSIASPPIAVPSGPAGPAVAGTKPQVESFDERKHVCQPTDTDFAAVSKSVYNSDKYAQALIEYNRDHPLGKAAVQQAPKLQPGAEVYVPPVHVLETRYPNAIQNLRSLPPDRSKSPDPGPSPPPKAMVPVVPGPANAGQYKLYSVAPGGQQFYEIARDTLGSGTRWSEIYQLNQQYDPQLMVPAGTQLKLPADAHVGQ